MQNFLEVFFTKIPPSKNNFRARVPPVQVSHAHIARTGFMGPGMVIPGEDLVEGRKPVIWDESGAGPAGDLEAGLDEALSEGKAGSFASSVSTDLAGATRLGGSERRVALNTRHSSWGRKSGNWEMSPDVLALAAGIGESNRTIHSSTDSISSRHH